ncbi:MAG: DNA alkylation repair protein [Clostridiales Family XIII bacterium]|nr:DNA alkylation repair protein [Clostridiales Family XIII bacterium]
MDMVKDVDKELCKLAEVNGEYAEFNKRIANTDKEVLGVRMPAMRRLAKSVATGKASWRAGARVDAKTIMKFLRAADKDVYEQVLFAGLLINYAELTDEDRIGLAREYLKYADSWALVDLFAERMKRFDRGLWMAFAGRCLASRAEFTVRYGVIILMSNYLDDESVDEAFAELRKVNHDAYYVKMALAWLYATAAVNHYGKTLRELAREGLDPWTRRKSYQKMLESYRFTPEQKDEIRALRANMPR